MASGRRREGSPALPGLGRKLLEGGETRDSGAANGIVWSQGRCQESSTWIVSGEILQASKVLQVICYRLLGCYRGPAM